MLLLKRLNRLLTQENPLSFNFYEIIEKIICFILIVICIGLPIKDVFSFVIIFVSGLLIINGEIKRSFKRLAFAFFIAITIFLIKDILPRAAIEEGHNIFLLREDKGALERGLPKEVFSFMKQEYLKRYPTDNQRRPVPQSVFSFSADSVFSKPKYSRIVDGINFNNLVEFRGGFANDSNYGWYGEASVIKRESMPFFVMYELPLSSVNSYLCWTGYLLWEDSLGHFQPIYNQVKNCRKVTSADVGRRIFGVAINNKEQMGFWDRFNGLKAKLKFFPSAKNEAPVLENQKEVPLSMHLILSPLLRLASALKLILEALGVFLILRLKIKVSWRRFILAALIIAIAGSIVYFYCPELFGQYYIHEGGEDGVTHQTLGSSILRHAISGDWSAVLRGGEDVFWNTPGFRYFRALEKFLCGDTNFGNLAVVLLLPYILFGFLANFISKTWSFWASILFLLLFLPFHILDNLGLSYYMYVLVTRGGWPDVVAYAAFLGALTLALRYIKTRSGAYYWYGFMSHFLFFITVFMRPQFAVTVLIIVIYLAFRLILERRFKEISFSWLGLIPVFFPLLHNYFFGHKFCLFTGFINQAVTTPLAVYLNAFREFLVFNFSGHNLILVMGQLKKIIGPWYRLVFLLVVFFTAFIKRKVPPDLRMIAIACLSLHFINLFIFATYFRYVLLTWALTAFVTLFLIWLKLKNGKSEEVS